MPLNQKCMSLCELVALFLVYAAGLCAQFADPDDSIASGSILTVQENNIKSALTGAQIPVVIFGLALKLTQSVYEFAQGHHHHHDQDHHHSDGHSSSSDSTASFDSPLLGASSRAKAHGAGKTAIKAALYITNVVILAPAALGVINSELSSLGSRVTKSFVTPGEASFFVLSLACLLSAANLQTKRLLEHTIKLGCNRDLPWILLIIIVTAPGAVITSVNVDNINFATRDVVMFSLAVLSALPEASFHYHHTKNLFAAKKPGDRLLPKLCDLKALLGACAHAADEMVLLAVAIYAGSKGLIALFVCSAVTEFALAYAESAATEFSHSHRSCVH